MPAQALLFHSLTAHGSDANESPNPRHTALFAAFSPAAQYVPNGGGKQSANYRVISGLDGAAEHTMRAAGSSPDDEDEPPASGLAAMRANSSGKL